MALFRRGHIRRLQACAILAFLAYATTARAAQPAARSDAIRSLPGKWWGEPSDTSAVASLLTPSAWSPGGQPAYNDTWVVVSAAASVAPSEALVNTP